MAKSNLTISKDHLEQFNLDLNNWYASAKSGNFEDVLRMFFRVREGYNELEDARKRLNEKLEEISRQLIPEVMLERQVKTITLADVERRFTVSTRISCSIAEGKKEPAFIWLRGHDAGALIQETVNAGTLSAFAKSQLEDKGTELPPDLFKTSTMQFTSITKVAAK